MKLLQQKLARKKCLNKVKFWGMIFVIGFDILAVRLWLEFLT